MVVSGSGNYSEPLLNGYVLFKANQSLCNRRNPCPDLDWYTGIDKNIEGFCWYWLCWTMQCVCWPNNFFDHTVRRQYRALFGAIWKGQRNGDSAAGTSRYRKLFEAQKVITEKRPCIIKERFNYNLIRMCTENRPHPPNTGTHEAFGSSAFNDETWRGDANKGYDLYQHKQFAENSFAICPRQALHTKHLPVFICYQ